MNSNYHYIITIRDCKVLDEKTNNAVYPRRFYPCKSIISVCIRVLFIHLPLNPLLVPTEAAFGVLLDVAVVYGAYQAARSVTLLIGLREAGRGAFQANHRSFLVSGILQYSFRWNGRGLPAAPIIYYECFGSSQRPATSPTRPVPRPGSL